MIYSIRDRSSLKISKILTKINLPIVPIWIGLLFVLNTLLARLVIFSNLDNIHRSLSEIFKLEKDKVKAEAFREFINGTELQNENPNQAIQLQMNAIVKYPEFTTFWQVAEKNFDNTERFDPIRKGLPDAYNSVYFDNNGSGKFIVNGFVKFAFQHQL